MSAPDAPAIDALPAADPLAVIPAARWWRGLPVAAIGLVLAVVIALLAPGEGYYLNIVMQAVTYAIGVAGIVVVLGYCGQISLTQAGFLGIGAYVLALLTTRLGVPFLVALRRRWWSAAPSACCSASPACVSAGTTSPW